MPTDNRPFHTLSITTSDVLENQRPNPATADDDDNAEFEAARKFLDSLGPEAQEDLRQELSILAMNDQHYQFFDDTCATAFAHILNRARSQVTPDPLKLKTPQE